MQLTLKGDYAVRVIVDLAGRPPGATIGRKEIGRRTGVPQPFLSKIIQSLARAGLVRTRRGTHGGTWLSESPAAITLRRVIEAAEGPIYLNRCVVGPGACPRDAFCPVHPVWTRVQRIVVQELDSVHISDLVQPPPMPVARTQDVSRC